MALWGGVRMVAPEPSPYMVLRTVWMMALRLDGVVFQHITPEPHPVYYCGLVRSDKSDVITYIVLYHLYTISCCCVVV